MLELAVCELRHKRNNPRNSEGAFITLNSGRILFIYSRYYGNSWSDVATAELAAIHSDDGGRSWSSRCRRILPNEGGCNVMSPSLLRLRDGRIALFYLRTNDFHDCRLYMRISADECRTWGEPRLCIPAPGYFVVNNDRVIQLKSGRILIPAAYHRPKLAGRPHDWEGWDYRAVTIFFYSDDAGESWRESADWWGLPVSSRSGMQEPGVVELSDGTLYAWARTDTGRQWEMFSDDGGDHWSPPQPSRFVSPNASMSIKQVPATGRLLAVWNDHGGKSRVPDETAFGANSSWGRTPLAMATSRNEGGTWSRARLLEADPASGYCYTAIHVTKEAVLLAYCCGGRDSGVLQDTRIRRVALQ